MNKLILHLTIATLWCLTLSHTTHAQINKFFPGTWKDAPTLTPITDPNLFTDNFTVIEQKVAISFDLADSELQNSITHARYQYRRLRINTAKGADSLRSIVTYIRKNEAINYMRGRIIKPDGKVEELDGQLEYELYNQDTKGILNIARIAPGSELEYETRIYVSNDYAGREMLQTDYLVLHAGFKLIAPRKYLFSTKSHNGFPTPNMTQDATRNIYEVNTELIPALKHYTYQYYEPMQQGIEYSLKTFVNDVDKKKKDTVNYSWQGFGEEQFMHYFYLDKTEFARLQKEMSTWAFLKQQKPLPLLIYQVQHYLGSKYRISNSGWENYEDINTIIKTRYTSEIGYVKLMAGVFYILGIRCQLMITNDRTQLPLDSSIVRLTSASNVLLYFPDIDQAMAPNVRTYQTPFYPPMWANIPALVCSDTLINNVSKIKTSFRNTPVPDYTTSGLRNTTEIWFTDTPGTARLHTTQQFSGLADAQLKTVLYGVEANPKETFASFILLRPDTGNISNIEVINKEWSPTSMNQPLTIKSDYTVPAFWFENTGRTLIRTGGLLSWQYQPATNLPPADMPVEMPYPCYFEKKVIVHLPPGYKVKNAKDFETDLSNIDPDAGLRSIYHQEGNTVTLMMMEWYKKISYSGNSRKAFDKIAATVLSFRGKTLILEKE